MSTLLVNSNVLLLNQNYEPLQICSARRAIVLMFQGKAEMIESADGIKIRTITKNYPLPSVVRLWHYKKVPFKRVMLSRKNVMTRDDHCCQYCGTGKGPMTVDHILPRKLGGTDSWENLVCACARCNNRKGDRLLHQTDMNTIRIPRRPSFIRFIQRTKQVSDRWRPFLFMESN